MPKLVDGLETKEVNIDSETTSDQSSGVVADIDSFSIDYSKLRFFVRPFSGLTRKLQKILVSNRANRDGSVPLRVLIEGPYSTQHALHHFDNVLFTVGGSGITATLQYLQTLVDRKRGSKSIPNVHLVWAVRQEDMLHDLNDEMQAYRRLLDARVTVHTTEKRSFPSLAVDTDEKLQHVERIAGWATALNGRPNVYDYVRLERESRNGSLAVVSCSPPAMADDTRQAVVNAMRVSQSNIELIQESFSW